MITKDKLADVCRANDNLADLGRQLGEIIGNAGVEMADALYVAKQRALRMLIIMRDEDPRKFVSPDGSIALSIERHEMDLYTALVGAWLDGLLVGVKAQKKEQG